MATAIPARKPAATTRQQQQGRTQQQPAAPARAQQQQRQPANTAHGSGARATPPKHSQARQENPQDENQAMQELGGDWETNAPIDAEDTPFGGGLVPADFYTVTVDKAYYRESKSSGRDYVNFEMRIVDGQFEGRFLFAPFYVNSESENFRKGQKGFLAKFFQSALGVVPESFPTSDEDLAELVGTEVIVKVVVEDGQDANGNSVEQNRVVRVRGVNDPDPNADETTNDNATTQPRGRQQPQQQQQQRGRQAASGGNRGNGSGGAAFDDMEDDIPV